MKKESLNKPGMKINGNSFLLMVTVLLFIVMYAAGMVIFADKGFAKPQMFLNLFISNAGLLVIAMGQTIVMITGGIDFSDGSVTALVCMLCAYDMEKKGMIADRCEINRQIRADNKMLRELKAQVAKLAEAVEKSIPIIAETLEAIRNHMIFTQYHLLRKR